MRTVQRLNQIATNKIPAGPLPAPVRLDDHDGEGSANDLVLLLLVSACGGGADGAADPSVADTASSSEVPPITDVASNESVPQPTTATDVPAVAAPAASIARIDVGGDPHRLSLGAGAVWVANTSMAPCRVSIRRRTKSSPPSRWEQCRPASQWTRLPCGSPTTVAGRSPGSIRTPTPSSPRSRSARGPVP